MSQVAHFQERIREVENEIETTRAKLKHQDTLSRKEKKYLHHKISQLYEELKGWKYRIANFDQQAYTTLHLDGERR